jgi:hypothetical protein
MLSEICFYNYESGNKDILLKVKARFTGAGIDLGGANMKGGELIVSVYEFSILIRVIESVVHF